MTPAPTPIEALKPCPFCKKKMTRGLTKKTGCQMHGDPVQYVTLSCGYQYCPVRPSITGGCRYRGGDKPKFEAEERQELEKQWNDMLDNQSQPTDGWKPIASAPRDGTVVDLYGTRNGKPMRFPNGRWIEETVIGQPIGRFRFTSDKWDIYGEFVYTHWRELPNPLTTSEEEI